MVIKATRDPGGMHLRKCLLNAFKCFQMVISSHEVLTLRPTLPAWKLPDCWPKPASAAAARALEPRRPWERLQGCPESVGAGERGCLSSLDLFRSLVALIIFRSSAFPPVRVTKPMRGLTSLGIQRRGFERHHAHQELFGV